MRDRLDYSAENCSVMRTLDVVGERWTLLVLREAMLGLRRFDDFQCAIGCARNILSQRLAKLVEHGLLRREPYREPGQRARDEYRLTPKGTELATAVIALMQWGDRHLADPAGAPLEVRHRDCGKPLRATLRCPKHGDVAANAIALAAGPGARRIA